MNEDILAAIADTGLPVVALLTFLACLGLPAPGTVAVMAAGALASAGGLSLGAVLATAWIAAVLGDQAGFALGRRGGEPLLRRLERSPRRAALVAQARGIVARHGGAGVFLSRWLVAPAAPSVNILAGAAGMSWRRFALWSAAGEAIWAGGYGMLGYVFAAELPRLVERSGAWAGVAALAAVLLALLWAGLRARRRRAGA